MADAADLKSVVRKDVRVRLPPSAPPLILRSRVLVGRVLESKRARVVLPSRRLRAPAETVDGKISVVFRRPVQLYYEIKLFMFDPAGVLQSKPTG
jgi:hypothetical protein